jgi:phage shock protein C
MQTNRLYRSRKDRVIWGVAGGLAEYLGIDPVLVRIAFVLLCFAYGVTIIAYIIMAIAVPNESVPVAQDVTEEGRQPEAGAVPVEPVREERLERDEELYKRRRYVLGGGLVIVGAIVLASNLSPWFWKWDQYWPVLIIVAGAAILVAGMNRRSAE